MNATDDLRRMLDERSVFWIDIPRVRMTVTHWKLGEKRDYFYCENPTRGTTMLLVSDITPEQVIAATVDVVRKDNLLAEMPESMLENRCIQIRELGIEVV